MRHVKAAFGALSLLDQFAKQDMQANFWMLQMSGCMVNYHAPTSCEGSESFVHMLESFLVKLSVLSTCTSTVP